MSSSRWEQIKQALHDAMQMTPAEQGAYLDRLSTDDPGLCREVKSLLSANEEAGEGFLNCSQFQDDLRLSPGSRIADYEIVELIAVGGMSEVYCAYDSRLDRRVAIKVLPHAFSNDPERLRRFEREARAVAALNHPNIIAVYDADVHEDLPFMVTELLEGKTLRSHLESEKPCLDIAIDFALQIAQGLAVAHDKGIIHRDLKPENIFVTNHGPIKILDFGLAKLTGAWKTEKYGKVSGTRAGVILGTTSYMSPEQVRGGPVDVATDIWSWGVVLYEMLSARNPFEAPTTADVMAAILHEQPVPPCENGTINNCVLKAMSKRAEERYPTMRDAIRRLTQVSSQSGAITDYHPKWPQFNWTAIMARALYWRLTAIMIVIATLAVGSTILSRRSVADISSIAVLSFENATGDSSLNYMSDGLAENVLDDLKNQLKLRVVDSRGSSLSGHSATQPQEIGQKSNVDAVLAGKLQRESSILMLQVDLVRVSDATKIWSRQFRRSEPDVTSFHRDIYRGLAVRFSWPSELLPSPLHSVNWEAYELYLKGKFYRNKRTVSDGNKSIQYFQGAIKKDPQFALAYSALADAYASRWPVSLESAELAERTAAQALQLDGTLGEPHTVLGSLRSAQFHWTDAEQEFRRAIALSPNLPSPHSIYAFRYCLPQKRYEEAAREFRKAIEVEPFTATLHSGLGIILFYEGKYDQAAASFHTALELDPNSFVARQQLSQLYAFEGKYDQAASEIKKAFGDLLFLPRSHLDATSYWKAVLEMAQQNSLPLSNQYAVYAYTVMGKKDKAFAVLNKAYKENDRLLVTFIRSPLLADLRSDIRYAALMQKMDLPL